jgi:hypothetical protein
MANPGPPRPADLFVPRRKAIKSDACVFCEAPAKEFKDEISKKEFTVSGLCQTCQDKTFG